MKQASKKFSAISIIVAMLLSMCQIVLGDVYPYDISVSKTDGESVIFNIINNAGGENAKAIISFYDKESRLLKTEITNVTAKKGENQEIKKSFSLEYGQAVKAKAFVWNSISEMKSVSEAAEAKLVKENFGDVIEIPKVIETADNYAEKFSDIDGSEKFAEAVSLISELGIMGGYNDNTFRSNEPLTRGEAARIAVKMLARQKTAELLKSESLYTDVAADSEINGAINFCSYAEIISGKDGRFRPDEAITCGDFIKAMVEIIGYHTFAEASGGWPIGYLDIAEKNKILTDISAGLNEDILRGEAAKAVYNTLFVPISTVCRGKDSNGDVSIFSAGEGDISLMSETATGGGSGNVSSGSSVSGSILYPINNDIEILDGKAGNDYETLLTAVFNIYMIEGYISETSKSNSALNHNEARYNIEKTKNYDNSDIVIDSGNRTESVILSADDKFDIEEFLFIYSKALVKIDERYNATIIRIKPTGETGIASVSGSLVDYEDYNASDNPVFAGQGQIVRGAYIKYFESKEKITSKKYRLSDNLELFVNGVGVNADKDNFEKYVVNNKNSEIEFIDRCTSYDKSDGIYDIIKVQYYTTARISSLARNGIYLEDVINGDRINYINLDPLDEDLNFNIYIDGAPAKLSELSEGNIISIAYDTEFGLDYSYFYEIYASTVKTNGKYVRNDPDKGTVKIGSQDYEFVSDYLAGDMHIGTKYLIYLDAFGRIFNFEEYRDLVYAIADEYAKSSDGNTYGLTAYGIDGNVKYYEINIDKEIIASGSGQTDIITGDNINTYFKNLVYKNGESGEKKPIWERMIKYEISDSKGKIIYIAPVPVLRTVEYEKFNENALALGTIKMNQNTVILDACDYVKAADNGENPNYEDIKLYSAINFDKKGYYSAYAYGNKDDSRNPDGTYSMVIVTNKSN